MLDDGRHGRCDGVAGGILGLTADPASGKDDWQARRLPEESHHPSLSLPPPQAAEGRGKGYEGTGDAAASLSVVAPPTRGRWRVNGVRFP